MGDKNDDVREGMGFILFVIALFLLVLLFGTAESLIDFINGWLEAH